MSEKSTTIIVPPSVERNMYPLYLSDDIDNKTSFSFTTALSAIVDKRRRILLHLNSRGGQSMDALCIVDALRAWSEPFAVIATGLVASAGTYLLAAGHLRLAYSHSHFLFHPASSSIVFNNKAELTSGTRYLEGLDDSWSHLYQDCIGLTKKEVDKLCANENYLNSIAALNLGTRGLIDGIILKLLDGFKYEILMRGGVRKVVDLASDDYNDIRDLSVEAVKNPDIVTNGL